MSDRVHAHQHAHDIIEADFAISAKQRAAIKGQRARVLWLTGLSGAGKSTIANALDQRLIAMGRHSFVLDGDTLRKGLNADLGFSDLDRTENIRRTAEVSKLMADAGLIVIVAFISPFRADRQFARSLLAPGDFVEIFIDTPLSECQNRDPKGLYKKALSGMIQNFTGISSPYEAPDNPEIRLETIKGDVSHMVEQIIDYLIEHP